MESENKGQRKRAENGKSSPDAVETPTPPQHMDPSKKPEKGNDKQEKKNR